jgi:hypothetical protein
MVEWVDCHEFLEICILYVAHFIVPIWKLIIWQYSYPTTTIFCWDYCETRASLMELNDVCIFEM